MGTILIADDHHLIFDGIQHHIGDKHTLLAAQSVEQALQTIGTIPLHACILDIKIGNRTGFECLDALPPETPAFMLSMHKSGYYAQKARKTGARGYFLKDEPLDLLFAAINAPHNRMFWATETVMKLFEGDTTGGDSGFEVLSSREQQIFMLLADGLSCREIAERLIISPKTVNVHRDHIMEKLSLEKNADIMKKAIEWGVLLV